MRHVQPDDAGERAARDHDVVERRERPRRGVRPAGSRPARRHPLAERVARRPAASRARASSSSVSATDRKPDLAQVDAQDRDVDLGDRLRPRAGTCRRRRARRGCRCRRSSSSVVGRVARRRGPLLHAVHPAPAGRPLAELERVLDGGVVREADPARPSPGALPGGARRDRVVDQLVELGARPGPAWRWTRNSRLPSGPWIGDAMTARMPSPSARRAPSVSRRTRRWTAGSRTTPPFASALPGLELGLDEREDRAARRRAGPSGSGPSTRPSEMNETSTTARSTGSGSVVGRQRAGVDALHRDDPRRRGGAARRAARSRRRSRRRGGAPRSRRTSVNPPVDAPTSIATRPATDRSRTRRAPRAACARRG